MNSSKLPIKLFQQSAILFSLLSFPALIGCSLQGTAGPSAPTPIHSSLNANGKVFGGQQPVVGATIQLWTVGTTGYGFSGQSLLQNAVQTATDGSFDLTGNYNCPSPSTLVYITSTSGNPGAGTNSASVMAAPLGECGNLSSSTYIWMNEITTAATAFAIGQYFTTTYGASSTDSFGAPSTTQAEAGITNAFATASNLVDVSSGSARSTVTLTGTGTLGSVQAVPESQKLITIANVLAACVNSDGPASSACSTLFTDVTPTGGTTPTDTLQAAVDMSLNPTSNGNVTTLFNNTTATSAFSGGLSSAPRDWTIGIQYTGSDSTNMSLPNGVAIDASGNVWLSGYDALNTIPSGLTELSPNGTPLYYSGTTASIVTSATTRPISAAVLRSITIDLDGNVWMGATSGGAYGVLEYNTGGVWGVYADSKAPFGVAVDSTGNVFAGHESTGAGSTVIEFPVNAPGSTGNTSLPLPDTAGNQILYTFPIAGPTPGTAGITSTAIIQPQAMALDSTGNLWMSNSVLFQPSSTANYVVNLAPINNTFYSGAACTSSTVTCALGTSTTQNTYTSSSYTLNEPTALAAGSNASMWVSNYSNNTVSDLTSLSDGTTYGSSPVAFNKPVGVAVDGAGNAWVVNYGVASVSEISSTGTVLSPTGSAPGFAHAGLNGGYGIAIDPSGNVWVANYTSHGGSGIASTVEEIVGAAIPAVTPLALGLKTGGSSFPVRP